jgi:homopolymeric O-antigen transport system permease protein
METALRTARAASVPQLLNPLRPYADLWRHRELIRQFTVRYFLARYRGTYLGVAWALLFPLIMLAVYTFVFNTIFTVRWGQTPGESQFEFALVMFCGLILFGVFSESSVRSVGLVLDNPSFVKKVVFPVEILPVASLGSSLLYAAMSMLLVLAGTAFLLHRLTWTALVFPVVLVPLVALSLGVGWFLASLGVFVRDTGNLAVLVIQQLLFFMTPIFYRVENLPAHYQRLAKLNPLTVIVDGGRRTLMRGELPDWVAYAWCLALSLVVMQLGYAWFMKSKRGFADVL